MKTIRKFALALLSIAMLFTLTSCGGSSASTESQLTSKINEKLSGTGIQVSYDSKLNEKLVVYIDVYRNSGDETAAMEASGLDAEHYAVYASTSNSTINDAAAVLPVRSVLKRTPPAALPKRSAMQAPSWSTAAM